MWFRRFSRPFSLLSMVARQDSPSSTALQRTQFLKVNSVEDEPAHGLGRRSWPSSFRTLFAQFLGFLWLVPMISLLALNLSSHIIGPSAWCPRGQCSADSLNGVAIGVARLLDKADHNTLGVLQFVAKALELWFGFIAANLIYNITMRLTSRNDGLPLGLLCASIEVADPRSLFGSFDSTRSPPRLGHSGTKTTRLLLGFFVTFLVLICMLVNVMGPATAVLALPTLQWIDINRHAMHNLRSLNVASGPAGNNLFPECTGVNLTMGQYSCNSNSYAASLDAFVDLTIAGASQGSPFINSSLPSQEADVLLTFNATGEDLPVAWAPSRQVLRELSKDYENFRTAYIANTDKTPTNDDPQYIHYTSSLQTILERQGPLLGAYMGYYIPTNIIHVKVGTSQDLRCYEGYRSTIVSRKRNQYTKCLPVGTGWSSTNSHANFTIAGSATPEFLQVNVYFSDQAAYYNDTWNPELIPRPCLFDHPAKADTECPWETIFSGALYHLI